MPEASKLLYDLYIKAKLKVEDFNHLPEKDIRRKHIELFQSIITIAYINFEINVRFSETNREEFLKFFNGDITQAQNYSFNVTQNLNQNLIDTILFQTELIFRFYYSKIANVTPGSEKSIFKIIATIFEDTENNWQKEECKFLVLFWMLRNTIHTGGIYFVKVEGRKIEYKGQEYVFEYGKSPEFLKDNFSLSLISDILDVLKTLFESQKIIDLGYFEHPNYYALGK